MCLNPNNLAKVVDSLRSQPSTDDNALIDKFLATHDDAALLNEIIFRQPMPKQTRLHAAAGGKIFVYQWHIPTGNELSNAFHTAEMPHVFGNPIDNYKYSSRRFDAALSKKIQRMWTNLAKCGNPSVDDFNCPIFNATNQVAIIFDKNFSVKQNYAVDCNLLTPVLDHQFNLPII